MKAILLITCMIFSSLSWAHHQERKIYILQGQMRKVQNQQKENTFQLGEIKKQINTANTGVNVLTRLSEVEKVSQENQKSIANIKKAVSNLVLVTQSMGIQIKKMNAILKAKTFNIAHHFKAGASFKFVNLSADAWTKSSIGTIKVLNKNRIEIELSQAENNSGIVSALGICPTKSEKVVLAYILLGPKQIQFSWKEKGLYYKSYDVTATVQASYDSSNKKILLNGSGGWGKCIKPYMGRNTKLTVAP